jgi:ferrous iron transport protein A
MTFNWSIIFFVKDNIKENLTLTDLPHGQDARVKSVQGSGRVAKRLMELGVIPGVALHVVKSAPFGDPIEVRLRGYSLAMRRSEADAIEVAL